MSSRSISARSTLLLQIRKEFAVASFTFREVRRDEDYAGTAPGTPIKDVFAVLFQKEHDVERLRKEVAALRAAIPLLTEDGDFREEPPKAKPRVPDLHDQPLHDLKMYYPFARHRYEHG